MRLFLDGAGSNFGVSAVPSAQKIGQMTEYEQSKNLSELKKEDVPAWQCH